MERKQTRGFGSYFGEEELSLLEGTIISSLFPEAKEMTIKEIMKRTEYSYERVNSALKSLVGKKIVGEKKVGKTLVYSLDLGGLYAATGFDFYMLEREIEFIKKHREVYNAIKEIMGNPHIWMVVLFGSYSKGTESKQSDVDIICVSDNKAETEHFIKSLRYKYNVEFAPVVLPLHEFPKIRNDNSELWHDLRQYGIVFKGEDYFYSWMYKADNGH
jgi:predicted nucleotidyltransferase